MGVEQFDGADRRLSVDRRSALAALAALVGEGHAFFADDIDERYRTDLHRKSRSEPAIVVRPADTAQVAEALRLASAAGLKVTALGGATGLVGGGVSEDGGVLLSLERLTAITELDPESMTMTVQAGVTVEAAQAAAEEQGLLFPLDLGSRGSATIGGAVATNAGGTRVLRWGMMRDMVLGLEAVLADGTVVSSMVKSLKDNAGYDWKQLMIGSEGTLGVVTTVMVRLRAAPRTSQTALIAVDSVADVAKILRRLDARLGGRLSSFELMWNDFYGFVTTAQRRDPPLPPDYPIYVIAEALGDSEDADTQAFNAVLQELIEEGLVLDAVIAQSARQRSDLWAIRDDLLEPMAQLKPRYSFDVSMGLSDMARFVETTRSSLSRTLPDATVLFYGHGGDGNLHVTVGTHGADGGEVLANDAVYAATRDVGGSISAEHGVGRYKKPYLGFTRSPAEIALMRAIKTALDPADILNPGKVVPRA